MSNPGKHPVLDELDSLRLTLLRFPLVVGVVFIHNSSTLVALSGSSVGQQASSPFTRFLIDLVSQGVARISVPLFFLIAGFLFFGGFRPSTTAYFGKFRSRVGTLLVPFLFWNILTLVCVLGAQSWSKTSAFFSAGAMPISEYSPGQLVEAIFGIGRPPISYQFWFIRDLMLLTLATPLLYIALLRAAIPLTSALAGLWLLNYQPFYSPSIEATIFFALGAAIAIKDINIFCLDALGRSGLGLFVVFVSAAALTIDSEFGRFLQRVSILLGISSALWLTRFAQPGVRQVRLLEKLGGASFFVYACHEPMLTIFKKVSYRALQPTSSYAILALYFLLPVATISVALMLRGILSRTSPAFLRMVSGGRA